MEHPVNDTENINEKRTGKISYIFKILLWTFLIALIIKSFFIEAYKIPTSSMEKTLLAGDFILVNKASYSLSLPKILPLVNIKIPDYTFFTHSEPEQGDVVVFLFSDNWNETSLISNYVKRIIGKPGDTIRIINNMIFINGSNLLNYKINPGKKNKNYKADEKIFPDEIAWNGKDLSPFIVPWKGLTVELNHNNINFLRQLINREFEKNVVSIEGTVINIEEKPSRTYTFKYDHYFVMGDNQGNSMDSRHWGTIPENLIVGKASLIYWSKQSGSSFLNSIRIERIFQGIN